MQLKKFLCWSSSRKGSVPVYSSGRECSINPVVWSIIPNQNWILFEHKFWTLIYGVTATINHLCYCLVRWEHHLFSKQILLWGCFEYHIEISQGFDTRCFSGCDLFPKYRRISKAYQDLQTNFIIKIKDQIFIVLSLSLRSMWQVVNPPTRHSAWATLSLFPCPHKTWAFSKWAELRTTFWRPTFSQTTSLGTARKAHDFAKISPHKAKFYLTRAKPMGRKPTKCGHGNRLTVTSAKKRHSCGEPLSTLHLVRPDRISCTHSVMVNHHANFD